MDNSPNSTPAPAPIKKKTPLFTLIGVLMLILTIGSGAYFFLKQGATKKEISDLNIQKEALNQEIAKIDVETIKSSKKAQDILKIIEESEIPWSDVISKTQDLIPLDDKGKAKIIFSSYSGNEDGTINLSATTNPARGTETGTIAFKDVSDLISTFNKSNIFIKGFVPSIAKGITEDGKVILSFSFSADYAPQKAKRQ